MKIDMYHINLQDQKEQKQKEKSLKNKKEIEYQEVIDNMINYKLEKNKEIIDEIIENNDFDNNKYKYYDIINSLKEIVKIKNFIENNK